MRSFELAAIRVVAAFVMSGCGAPVADQNLEPAGEHERAADEGRADEIPEPFVWEETDIVDHLKLVLATDGAMPTYAYELSTGETCTIGSVLTSAVHVRVRSQDGPPRVAANRSGTAGVAISDGPGKFAPPPTDTPSVQQAPVRGAACIEEFERALEDLRPSRTSELETKDLEALDEALMGVARDAVDGGHMTWSDGEWWPGVQGSVMENEATVSGLSFGRCRQVVVDNEGAISAPENC